jgi:hypothetical protein
MTEDVARLIATINDNADPSHGDLTPSVHALVRLGLTALPAVLPVLESEDKWTRLRAQRVLEGATRHWVRERTPERPMTRKADYAWMKLWQDNGSYDWEAPADARAASLARWRAWLREQNVTG